MLREKISHIAGQFAKKRSERFAERIYPYIQSANHVLDLGAGAGFLTASLRGKGKDVTAVDMVDKCLAPGVKMVVYDGRTLPYPDRSFDACLLVTVLHHTMHPELILRETARVANQLVVVETSYRNLFEKLGIVLVDSCVNQQLLPFWRSYRSDAQWRGTFSREGLRILASKRYVDHDWAWPYLHLLYELRPDAGESAASRARSAASS